MTRIGALLRKDLLELRLQPGIFVPALVTGAISLLLPFLIAVGVPTLTGERLGDSNDFGKAAEAVARVVPAIGRLGPEARVQAMLFQQFVMLLVLVPMSGSMAIAAHAIIGEKQARTLEPLLATPIGTGELLAAKVLAALLPALALSAASTVLYFAGIRALAEPGVLAAVVSAGTLMTLLVLGPLAALIGLQLAVIASSRASDPRSAQQIGVVLILPLTALIVAQLFGAVVVTGEVALALAGALVAANAALLALAIRLFDREAILTRWR